MAFHLLERDRDGALQLSRSLVEAVDNIGHCQQCRTFSEETLCAVCANPKRDNRLLCVVESPIDMQALEQATQYKGLYFVLMGHLSPLDGIGPQQIGLDKLEALIQNQAPQEIILATNPTAEGEATAHYISEMVAGSGIKTTRIAHGVPLGGELEYVDGGTLSHAFSGRQEF